MQETPMAFHLYTSDTQTDKCPHSYAFISPSMLLSSLFALLSLLLAFLLFLDGLLHLGLLLLPLLLALLQHGIVRLPLLVRAHLPLLHLHLELLAPLPDGGRDQSLDLGLFGDFVAALRHPM